MRNLLPVVVAAACGSGSGPVMTKGTVEPSTTAAWGTAAPYDLVAVPPDGRWAVICQARQDTNGDGKLDVFYEIHGEFGGDEMVAYLIDPDGHERAIENVLAVDEKGRWLAIAEAGAPVLIDTTTGATTQLVGTLPEFHLLHGLRRWAFDPTGERLLFFRDDKPIVRELATGEEVEVAPAAWSAGWSVDGAWVVLDHLGGDTDGDGFIHGPNLAPSEGIPGTNCGRKMKWGGLVWDLIPADGATEADTDRAMASMDRADKLERSLWRASDRKRVAAFEPVDHDTVIVSTGGKLVLTAVGETSGTELGPDTCVVGAVLPATRSIVYTCPTTGGKGIARWFRDGKRRDLMETEDMDPLVDGSGTSFFSIFPGQLIGDLRTGEQIVRGRDYFLAWSDAERIVIARRDNRAELRWPDGKRLQMTRDAYGPEIVAGRYIVYGATRVDLDARAVVQLDVAPIWLRSDGAVLVDGGAPPPEPGDEVPRFPRLGPLRWAQVR